MSAPDASSPVPQTLSEHEVRERVFQGHAAGLCRVAMPEDGRFALTTSEDGTLRQWKLDGDGVHEGVILHHGDEPTMGLAVRQDGVLAAVGGGSGQMWLLDLRSHEIRWRRQMPEMSTGHLVGGLAFSTAGDLLASADELQLVHLWRTETGELLPNSHGGPDIFNVAISGDGSQIVAAGLRQGLFPWDGQEDYPCHPSLPEEVASMAPVCLTKDGRLAWTGNIHGQVAGWDVAEGRRVQAFEGHAGEVCAVAVTPDGRRVVSGGQDKTVRLWDVTASRCLAVLRGHEGQVNHVAVTPDGRRIASAADDGTLRVWDLPE